MRSRETETLGFVHRGEMGGIPTKRMGSYGDFADSPAEREEAPRTSVKTEGETNPDPNLASLDGILV